MYGRVDGVAAAPSKHIFACRLLKGARRVVHEGGLEYPNGVLLSPDQAKLAVAVCPQITFVDRGGEVTGTVFGTQDEAELVERIEEL